MRAACPLEVFRCWRAGEIGAGVSEEDGLKHSGAGAASRALPVSKWVVLRGASAALG